MGPFLFSCVLDDDENCCSTKRESVLGAGATAPAGRRPENRPEAIRANEKVRPVFQFVKLRSK